MYVNTGSRPPNPSSPRRLNNAPLLVGWVAVAISVSVEISSGERVETVGASRDGDHARALGQQLLDDASAEASASTRHDGFLVLEAVHRGVSSTAW